MRSSKRISHLLAGPLAIAAVAAIGVGASAMSASASTVTDVLYSTQGDFSGWAGTPASTAGAFDATVTTVATPTEGGTTDGIASATPGALGTAGALQITMPNGIGVGVAGGYQNLVNSPGGLQGNTALVTAFDNAIAANGHAVIDFTYPAGNTYFNPPLLLLNYAGNYEQVGQNINGQPPVSVASATADANGFYTDTISLAGLPNIAAAETAYEAVHTYGYFNMGLIFSAEAPAGSVVDISNISLTYSTPEPASLGLLGAGAAGLLLLGRKRIFA